MKLYIIILSVIIRKGILLVEILCPSLRFGNRQKELHAYVTRVSTLYGTYRYNRTMDTSYTCIAFYPLRNASRVDNGQ